MIPNSVMGMLNDHPIVALQLVANVLSLLYMGDALCRMTYQTRESVRWSTIGVSVGIFSNTLNLLDGHRPDIWETVMFLGITVFLIANCRRYIYPEHCPMYYHQRDPEDTVIPPLRH